MSEILRLGVDGVIPVTWHDVSKSNGGLTGYASVWNVVDDQGDVVLPGAFKRTIDRWKQSGRRLPMHDGHDWSNDAVIGSFDSLSEEAYGLLVSASFSSDPRSQALRIKTKEKHISGLSIYGDIIRKKTVNVAGKARRGLEEIALLHIGLTSMPALHLAAITSVKSLDWVEPSIDDSVGERVFKEIFAVQMPGTDPKTKKSWILLHHTINQDGTPGPANMDAVKACLDTLPSLGLDEATAKAAREHLESHIDEAKKSDPLPDEWVSNMRSALNITNKTAQRFAVDVLIKERNSELNTQDPKANEEVETNEDTEKSNASNYALDLIGENGSHSGAPGSDSDYGPLADLLAPHRATQVVSALSDLDKLEKELLGDN